MKKVKFYVSAMFFIAFILQGCSSDYTKSLGDGYFYRFEGGELNDIYNESPNPNGREIPATVVAYDFDDDFIIAKQKPRLPQDILYDKEYTYSRGDTALYYWLIIKKKHLVLGPLSFEEFKTSRIKFKVPDNIMLK